MSPAGRTFAVGFTGDLSMCVAPGSGGKGPAYRAGEMDRL